MNKPERMVGHARAIAEHGPDAMWVFDVESFQLIDVNRNFEALTGLPRERLIGATPMDVSPPLQAGGVPTEDYARGLIARTLDGEKVIAPWTVRHVDGHNIPCELRAIHFASPGRTLICGSMLDIRARRQAEQELQFRMQLESLIMRLSTGMIRLKAQDIDAGIQQALREVGEFAQVDRSYVFLFEDDGSRVSCTQEWCAAGIAPEIQRLQDLRVDDFPWVEARLRAGEVVHVPRMAEVPAEAAAERVEWQAEGIQSLLLVPMRLGDSVVGYVGFDSVRAEKAWPPDHIALLTIFGEMVSNALERARTESLLGLQRDTLERSNRELERSNVELKHFAYIASHDLQEPLRAISGFSSLLARQYKGKLDHTADEYIGFIVGAAGRLHHMITDLLDYSRIDTRAKPFEPCALEQVLRLALDNLRASVTELQAEITHEPLPAVMGDGPQLAQLFQNLLGNALKFHGPERPRIHIAAEWQDGEWEIRVRDNGIGIAPGDTVRLFQLFQRVHDREKYPGTGIGLAVCKRIVERHRGQIWVERNPDRGCTFHFTLPASRLSVSGLESGAAAAP